MNYPEMMFNILSLLCQEGDVLEIEGYDDGDVMITESSFPWDKRLGKMEFHSSFYNQTCHRDVYVNYSMEWLPEFRRWVNERYDLSSLQGDDTWIFKWEFCDNKLQFRDEVFR